MNKLKQSLVLTAPWSLVGVCVLLVNDFVLKRLFHNWLTGKLSDVAGLFILPLFISALLPYRRKYIYVATAVAFAFWKSSYSEPLINEVNVLLPFSIGRTVDMTDLAALLVLPVSYLYGSFLLVSQAGRTRVSWGQRMAVYAMGMITLIACTATTMEGDQSISYEKEYLFNVPRDELIRELYKTDLKYVQYLRLQENPKVYPTSEDRDLYTGSLNAMICKSHGMAYMNVYTRGEAKSALNLSFIHFNCDTKSPEHKRELLEDFEREVIAKLIEQQK